VLFVPTHVAAVSLVPGLSLPLCEKPSLSISRVSRVKSRGRGQNVEGEGKMSRVRVKSRG
jgi:hypothetical protein